MTVATRRVPRLTEQERFMLLRRRAGVTQDELAAEVRIKQSRISAWERGVIQLPAERVRSLWEAIDQLQSEKVG